MKHSSDYLTVNTLSFTIPSVQKTHFIDWQAKLSGIIAGVNGFISVEFLSAPDQKSNWKIVQRFVNPDALTSWLESKQYRKLVHELHELIVKDTLQETTENESDQKNGVTEVIITQVDPKREKEYHEWSIKIHQIEAKFKGFRGAYFQSPRQSQGSYWITLLQFDSPENLDRWLESNERRKILKEAESLISSYETHRMASPFSGWFYSLKNPDVISSAWKQTMLVLLVLFPIVMLELKYLPVLTGGMNTSMSTFIGNALSVTLIAFPMMPIVIRFLGWWLFPKQKNILSTTFAGFLLIMVLYLLEVCIFWNF